MIGSAKQASHVELSDEHSRACGSMLLSTACHKECYRTVYPYLTELPARLPDRVLQPCFTGLETLFPMLSSRSR
jgi:hypothetical protein